jgi:hypothetical protein
VLSVVWLVRATETRQQGGRRWPCLPCQTGVEGTGSYGAGLARWLRAHGQAVLEVDRPDRAARRRQSKADTLDAHAAARAVRAGTATGTPKAADGQVEMIRSLHLARRSASRPAPRPPTSPGALVDRWAATAVLRIGWSTAPVSVVSLPPPAVRLVPHWGQMVACWSSLAEQAGHVLCMLAPWSAPALWGACWGSIDDGLRGPLRRRPQSDTWRSAGRRS